MESTRGKLLVAAPSLADPNFRLTVLLMLEHGAEGALGVVLNRPSELTVKGAIDEWDAAVSEPRVVFVALQDAFNSLALSREAFYWI
ncbi:MAG: YqgE/AlgH family protein, partial [Acidimicrobiaceae bacterium]|nr:YqgE/AlgH family protein [Acidimicrobiaceae bacterium]